VLRQIADELARHEKRETMRAQIFPTGAQAATGGSSSSSSSGSGSSGGGEKSSLVMRRLAADDARLQRLMHRAAMLQGMAAV
jgi:hypothetical protein